MPRRLFFVVETIFWMIGDPSEDRYPRTTSRDSRSLCPEEAESIHPWERSTVEFPGGTARHFSIPTLVVASRSAISSRFILQHKQLLSNIALLFCPLVLEF